MFTAPCSPRTSVVALVLAVLLVSDSGSALAQMPVWSQPAYGGYPAGVSPAIGWQTAPPLRQAAGPPRGPLARLVRNPNSAGGLPPFALADQAGVIQRLVEPVPGIDLETYVGEIVSVRHDTGKTLLATQLELPSRTMMGETPIMYDAQQIGHTAPAGDLLPARFADDSDETTELVQDDRPAPANVQPPNPASGGPPGQPSANQPVMMFQGGPIPMDVGPIVGGPAYGAPMYQGPMMAAPLAGNAYQGAVVIDGGACPQCGGFHQAPGMGQPCAGQYGYMAMPAQPVLTVASQSAPRDCHFFGNIEANFLRVHMLEDAFGKLSEKYELSPRFVVGVDGPGNFDARARYWIYDEEVRLIDDDENLQFKFNVFDVEGIHRIKTPAASLLLSAGGRFAHVELIDDDGNGTGADLIGITIAADTDVPLYVFPVGRLAGVFGGRMSILGGDWVGDDGSDFVPGRVRDDNVVVQEAYAGLQYEFVYGGVNLNARATFEMQNWHSDALAQNADTDSIGFLGPGLSIGATY